MQRIRVRWDGCLELGLVAVLAGCGGAAPAAEKGGGGDGGPPPAASGTGSGPTAPPPREASACSVAGDVALGEGEATSPSVAFGGGHFAAAWSEAGNGIQVALVDSRGGVAASRAVAAGPGAAEPSVAALPAGGFVVVWREPGLVRGVELAADASATGAPFTIAQTNGGDPKPTAASAAHETVVAWADATGVTAGELHGTTLGDRTTVAGATDPSLAAGGGATIGLVFATGTQLGHARLSFPGLHGAEPVLFRDAPGKADVPRASPTRDGGFFVTWEDDRGGDGNETVYLTRVGPDGRPGPEAPVPSEAGSANYPDVATVAGRAAVVYYQFRDGPSSVYLSLIGPDLRREGDDLLVSSQKGARYARIASSGEGALGVVYAERNGPAHLALVLCR